MIETQEHPLDTKPGQPGTRGRHLLIAAVLCGSSLGLTWLASQFGWTEYLLPYQLPVLFAGFLLPMSWAVGCAVAAPILGTIFLGFPEGMVMLPLVACQMLALAAFANFLYLMLDSHPFTVYALSVAFSYVILFCAASIYGAVSPGSVQPLSYVRNTIMQGWPSLILDMIAPLIILVVRGRKKHRAGL